MLADEVIDGSLAVQGELVEALDHGTVRHAEDIEGDYIIPGLVELHTDHFENHYRPRPGVTWNPMAALQAHDAQVAGAGITTVFDAIRIGSDPEFGDMTEDVAAQVGAIEAAEGADRLRAEHFVPALRAARRRLLRPFRGACGAAGGQARFGHGPYAGHQAVYRRLAFHRLLQEAHAALGRGARRVHPGPYRGPKLNSDRNRAHPRTGPEVGLAFASHDDDNLAHVDEAVADGSPSRNFRRRSKPRRPRMAAASPC